MKYLTNFIVQSRQQLFSVLLVVNSEVIDNDGNTTIIFENRALHLRFISLLSMLNPIVKINMA